MKSLFWILLVPVVMGASCGAQKVPTTASGKVEGTKLSAGDVAVVAFTTKAPVNDQFAFAVLKDVESGTQINISDENWDGTEFSLSDGGVIVWTADRDYPAGTVVQVLPTSDGDLGSTSSYAVNVYSGGATYTNVTGPGEQDGTYAFNPSSAIQVTTVANTGGGLTGLAKEGDQLIVYQGPTTLGASASGITFLGALNYGAAWLTGTPIPSDATGAGSYLPPDLVDGQTAIAISGDYGNGGYYDCSNGTTGSQSVLESLLNNPSNWVLSMTPEDLPIPAISCGLVVQSE